MHMSASPKQARFFIISPEEKFPMIPKVSLPIVSYS